MAGNGGVGCTVLSHKPTVDGFNVADASRHVSEVMSMPVVLLTWMEITERRYTEFKKYLAIIAKQCPVHGEKCEKKPTLTIHQGGKEHPPGDDPDNT